MLFFIFLLGLAFGSFISALTYRLPRGISFVFGRSFCPRCRNRISWYDNIPVLSFFLLRGRCRNCVKKISWRYPVIELSTAFGFLFIYYFVSRAQILFNMDWFAIPYILLVFLILEIVFIIDLEHKVIFDNLVFFLFALFFLTSVLRSEAFFWDKLFSAFFFSFALLVLNFITRGRGMGFGDVKLAMPLSFFLGFKLASLWLFVSFLLGAVVGVILVFAGKAKFGRPIPFGPFMIFSFWIILFFGEQLASLFSF